MLARTQTHNGYGTHFPFLASSTPNTTFRASRGLFLFTGLCAAHFLMVEGQKEPGLCLRDGSVVKSTYWLHACMRARVRVRTHMHTHAHTCTHMHTRIPSSISCCSGVGNNTHFFPCRQKATSFEGQPQRDAINSILLSTHFKTFASHPQT